MDVDIEQHTVEGADETVVAFDEEAVAPDDEAVAFPILAPVGFIRRRSRGAYERSASI